MVSTKARPLQAHARALIQTAKHAIRDVYDAVVELVTNADDRYQILKQEGRIEIEVERRRGKTASILRVRDFADGMDSVTMEKKLSALGGRDSGLAEGEEVRGTHSRGAKDVAALGRVVFESIAQDGRYHRCEISPFLDYIPHESESVTAALRRGIRVPRGTGTLVTIELDDTQRVPQHDNLRDQIERLVSLREILADDRRKLVLRDLGKDREDTLRQPRIEGTERVKETLSIPGYPKASAKLVIMRARQPFERDPDRFRLGGILIESKHAVHEATLFDPGLESDPHALWFYGRLKCSYIDDLCNDFDERFESKCPPVETNPTYLLDPSRRSGLTREHPFVKALFGEVLKRFRPLVEEERKRREAERASIESEATRKRLNALEKAAVDFLHDFGEEDDVSRDPDDTHSESRFMDRGYALSPPFAQMIVGHSRFFWFSVRQEAFPELEVGSTIQIECLSPDVQADKKFSGLEPHPTREGVLRTIWKVKAVAATAATGVRVRVGPITAETAVEILVSEADRYADVTELRFSSKRYRIRTDQNQKKIRILAPLHLVDRATPIQVTVDAANFEISGQQLLKRDEPRQIALCDLAVRSDGREVAGTLKAKMNGHEATATISTVTPPGAGLSIKLEDIAHGNQRYRWRKNVLEIAARHPALKRYLGEKQEGQESRHFRVLVAEVVAEAVCARLVGQVVQANPEEYEDADWDQYYADYTKYLTRFLPIAHKLQVPDPRTSG